MLDSLFHKNPVSKAILLSLGHTEGGEWKADVCHMSWQKSEIVCEVLQKACLLQDLEAYLSTLPPLPVLLNIGGESVFEQAVRHEAPGVSEFMGIRIEKQEEFILQSFKEHEDIHLGGVMRRSDLLSILSHLVVSGQRVISLYVGGWLPTLFLASAVTDFRLRQIHLSYPSGLTVCYEYGSAEGLFATKPEAGSLLLPTQILPEAQRKEQKTEWFAHFFLVNFAPDMIRQDIFVDTRARVLGQMKLVGNFQFMGAVLGAILSVMLLYYWSIRLGAYNNLDASAESEQIAKIQENIRHIQNLKQLSTQFKNLNQSYVSWMLDKIAHEKPGSIGFSRCVYKPTEEEWKLADKTKQEGMDFLIEGQASNSADVSLFVSRLEALFFINRVSILASEFGFQAETYHFSIAIYCK